MNKRYQRLGVASRSHEKSFDNRVRPTIKAGQRLREILRKLIRCIAALAGVDTYSPDEQSGAIGLHLDPLTSCHYADQHNCVM